MANALFQWEEGERRVLERPEAGGRQLERAVLAVAEELRRRLGSSFSVEELATLYSNGVDWGLEIAAQRGAGTDAAWVIDAAFARYAREATNFAGGRRRHQLEGP